MLDEVLQQRPGRIAELANDAGKTAEAAAVEDFQCFGLLRGIRDRAVMLELRKKTGNILAIPYGLIEKLEFDPSEGIRIHIGGQVIRIRGRNLNAAAHPETRLFQGLARHRVLWLQEAESSRTLCISESATIIEYIEW